MFQKTDLAGKCAIVISYRPATSTSGVRSRGRERPGRRAVQADVGLLKDRLEQGRQRLQEALEAIRSLCEPVEPPRDTQAYLRFFVTEDTADATSWRTKVRTMDPTRAKREKMAILSRDRGSRTGAHRSMPRSTPLPVIGPVAAYLRVRTLQAPRTGARPPAPRGARRLRRLECLPLGRSGGYLAGGVLACLPDVAAPRRAALRVASLRVRSVLLRVRAAGWPATRTCGICLIY